MVEAATQALGAIRKQAACAHPDDAWKWTHNNGHKTCGLCGYFTPCTVEEAFAHYDHGWVTDPERSASLAFDYRRPLCPTCGGRVLTHDWAFHIYRCACGQRLEAVNDKWGLQQHDENGYGLYALVDSDPEVVGFWHAERRLWLGEDGHVTTCRRAQMHERRWLIDRHLQDPGMELRLVNSDLTPGEPVPFSFDEEAKEAEAREMAAGLKAWAEALAAKEADNHPAPADT